MICFPGCLPADNESGGALRAGVIHREVTNGVHLESEATDYSALQLVIAAARFKGENVFAALGKLMGKPIGRYLQLSIQ
jgi:hypothetical protein